MFIVNGNYVKLISWRALQNCTNNANFKNE